MSQPWHGLQVDQNKVAEIRLNKKKIITFAKN